MADPTILAFDTSGPHCAAALLLGGKIVAARFEEMPRGQAERLFPMLDEVMGEVGAVWEELDAIGVGIGPGNFTGIRIAVSAARGLALSLEKPAVSASLFSTPLARGFRQPSRPRSSASPPRKGKDVYPILRTAPSRRNWQSSAPCTENPRHPATLRPTSAPNAPPTTGRHALGRNCGQTELIRRYHTPAAYAPAAASRPLKIAGRRFPKPQPNAPPPCTSARPTPPRAATRQ